MLFNPHKLGIHKVLEHIPLGKLFDAPYKARLRRAVNIADLRLIAKSRAHKVHQRSENLRFLYDVDYILQRTLLTTTTCPHVSLFVLFSSLIK
jgi:hypothetical protein